jgi:putative FmdB family regulatory protein
MPIYEYHCEDCGATFDKFVRSISAPVEVECPECRSQRCKKHFSTFGTAGSGSGSLSAAACAPSG